MCFSHVTESLSLYKNIPAGEKYPVQTITEILMVIMGSFIGLNRNYNGTLLGFIAGMFISSGNQYKPLSPNRIWPKTHYIC